MRTNRGFGTLQVAKWRFVDLSTLRSWGFLTRHGQMLLAVASNPTASVAELAEAAQITERSAYRLLADLQKAGYIQRQKLGRSNRYAINADLPLRDPGVEDEPLRSLLGLIHRGGRRRL